MSTLQRLPETTAAHELPAAVESYLADERRVAVRRAADAILAGRPGYAEYVLRRSIERQARIAGVAATLPTALRPAPAPVPSPAVAPAPRMPVPVPVPRRRGRRWAR